MNYLKAIRTITGTLVFIGFILMMGAVGKSDFADEIGEYIELKDFIPQMVVGLLLMIPCGLLESFLDKFEIGRGEENDNGNCIVER